MSCLNRYNKSLAVNGPSGLKIDACACDAIVTDCHVYAESKGSGVAENSGPFNVFNGVSPSAGRHYPTMQYTHNKTRWWNGNDFYMPDTVTCDSLPPLVCILVLKAEQYFLCRVHKSIF
jgi:hypothetical protein